MARGATPLLLTPLSLLPLMPMRVAAALPGTLRPSLEAIARHESKKYNCSISIAFRSADGSVVAASGAVDFASNRPAQTSDKYPWGSVTKMFTAASIMKLVAAGNISLDDRIAPLVDPILAKMAARDPEQNFSSVRELWGDHVLGVTIRQLLGMKDGVPDFDTATPSMIGPSKDPLRAMLYAAPSRFNTPTELMSVPWVAGTWKNCRSFPGMIYGTFCYSSTNYVLLGLVLAAQAGEDSWHSLNQSAFLPPSLRSEIEFANHGAPRDYGTAHGYDRTSYNMPRGHFNDHDNWEVDGVFAGWTASNIVATPSAVAELTWQIFGPPKGIAPKEFVDLMIPKRMEIYGLGAFNMGFQTGHRDSLGRGYGHLGATYGYQSVAGYYPELNIVLVVASNIETDNQAQPSDTLCLAYNAVVGALLHKTFNCTFAAHSYYGGVCQCAPQNVEIIV